MFSSKRGVYKTFTPFLVNNIGLNVKYMYNMFCYCKKFNKTLSKWKLEKVESTDEMFKDCKSFNKDLSMWEIPKNTKDMFLNCPIKDEFKPKI